MQMYFQIPPVAAVGAVSVSAPVVADAKAIPEVAAEAALFAGEMTQTGADP